MRAHYQGKIQSIVRNGDPLISDVVIETYLEGAVENVGPCAKKTNADITLTLKAAVAEKLSLGSKLNITITDEDSQEIQ